MKTFSTVLISTAAVASFAFVGSAHAATITTSLTSGLFTAESGTSLIDFSSGSPGFTANTNIRTGNTSNQNAAYPGNSTPYLVIQPTSPTVTGFTAGALTYTSSSLLNYFGFAWGSSDASNTVEFYNDTTLIATFTSATVGLASGASWNNPADNQFVNFFATGSSSYFNKVVFSTGVIAFEIDNVTTRAVPVPAVVPGIALAAAFFGSKALKRNKKETGATIV
jgi:hypothetical protein